MSGKPSIELVIPSVSLAAKINILGATLIAIRDAHVDELRERPAAWAAINRAHHQIAEAEFELGRGPCLDYSLLEQPPRLPRIKG